MRNCSITSEDKVYHYHYRVSTTGLWCWEW